MIIGTVRVEEAKVEDSRQGYHQDESYGSVEVFWFDGQQVAKGDCWSDDDGETLPAGWYWWACFPGCLPDSDHPTGPFASSIDAYYDATESD